MGGCCVMDNPIANFFRDIRDIFTTTGCGYTPGPSETEAHAKKIADELADMKVKIRESQEKREKQVIEYINRTMMSMLNSIEVENGREYGGKKLNINIQGIREKFEELEKEVVGSIGNTVEDRLVLTDPELAVVLEERDDKKRKRAFDAFCVRVQNEATAKLSLKIKETVDRQSSMVRKEIEQRLTEVNASMQEASAAYMEILESKKKEDGRIEEKQLKYMYQCELDEILLDQLEGE